MKRLITATVMLAIETESEIPPDMMRIWIEDHVGLRVTTVPLPLKEATPTRDWESAGVTRVHVERISEQEAPHETD